MIASKTLTRQSKISMYKGKIYLTALLSIIFVMLALSGCDEKRVLRQYEEILVKPSSPDERFMKVHGDMFPQSQGMGMQEGMMPVGLIDKSHDGRESFLDWVTPEDWIQQEGGGMRLASFLSQEEDPIQCTIIVLSGRAGGLEANVRRWLNQIDLSQLGDDAVSGFLNDMETFQSIGALSVGWLDFTALQGNAQKSTSTIIAGIVEIEGKTVFLKMTGTIKAVKSNQEKLRSLCTSLRMNNE